MSLYKKIIIENIDLKEMMKGRGMSIYRLSKLSGIPYCTLNYIVNDKTPMNEDNKNKIFAVLDKKD